MNERSEIIADILNTLLASADIDKAIIKLSNIISLAGSE